MKTIMVVDDDITVRQLTKAVLEKSGYRVLLAGTGREALALAGSELPDLAVIDINLPDLSGTQVANSLSQNPLTQRIPIIFLTGMLSLDEEKQLHNTLGGNFFLAKPCDREKLLKAVVKKIG